MSNGLKSIAQELSKHGRYGDTIVAHINPQEAALLKSLGGSGTTNPTTGLPEYWGGLGALNPFNPGSAAGKAVGSIPGVSQLQKAATDVFQPVEKAVVQPVSNALVDVDKSVAKMVPGGWGTLGMVAGSMMGLPTYAMVGLGALNGSGVMHPGRGFNLQGAVMGGAMAYGMSQLGQYARAAAPEGASSTFNALPETEIAPPTGSIEEALPNNYGAPQPTGYTAGVNGGMQPTYDVSAPLVEPPVAPPTASAPYEPPPFDPNYDPNAGIRQPIMDSLSKGEIGDAAKTVLNDISEGAKSAYNAAGEFKDAALSKSTYANAWDNAGKYLSDRATDFSQTSKGIGNLLTGPAGTSAAASAASGVNPLLATAATVYGGMGLSDAEAQYQYLKDQLAAGNIAQAEYDKLASEIERSANVARNAVSSSPFSTNPNRDVSIGDTYYGRGTDLDNLYARMGGESRLYAVGGSVDDESGLDEARGLAQGNLQNGFMGGGVPSYADGGMMPNYGHNMSGIQNLASGGQPRFLSGGGDGMSDSIPATINGKQEARLADGEFVIPADVVSHLGNGSSKAGAKQLYSMMDKVRAARTGTKKQGKQINPRKFLPA